MPSGKKTFLRKLVVAAARRRDAHLTQRNEKNIAVNKTAPWELRSSLINRLITSS
jgi:hypothetical protein